MASALVPRQGQEKRKKHTGEEEVVQLRGGTRRTNTRVEWEAEKWERRTHDGRSLHFTLCERKKDESPPRRPTPVGFSG